MSMKIGKPPVAAEPTVYLYLEDHGGLIKLRATTDHTPGMVLLTFKHDGTCCRAGSADSKDLKAAGMRFDGLGCMTFAN